MGRSAGSEWSLATQKGNGYDAHHKVLQGAVCDVGSAYVTTMVARLAAREACRPVDVTPQPRATLWIAC